MYKYVKRFSKSLLSPLLCRALQELRLQNPISINPLFSSLSELELELLSMSGMSGVSGELHHFSAKY